MIISLIDLLSEKQDLWEQLRRSKKPIYLYGMGNGADKIVSVLARLGIPVAGVYASDDHVRGHSFRGFPVLKYTDVRNMHREFISLLAFAVDYEPMLSYITHMSQECELYAPDVPVVKTDENLFDLDYLRLHENELLKVYKHLADEESRRVFLAVLNYKISGKISYIREVESSRSEVYSKLIIPSNHEVFVDLGAYRGDTVAEFLTFASGYDQIYAWEPDQKNHQKLCELIADKKLSCITPLPFAAWNKEEILPFQGGKGGRNSLLSKEGRCSVQARTLDQILNGQKASIIKMDVEGAEYEALMGARETITQWKPRLMLSAYHKNEDLFTLPLLVLSFNPNYRLYLRHHPYIPAWETNFYCI